MNAQLITKKFGRIGARASVTETRAGQEIEIDIRRDRVGEYFDIRYNRRIEMPRLDVIDVQPKLRHLLLMGRTSFDKQKFLCGHDERHWFVAAVPEKAAVSNVATAMQALKPPAVVAAERQARLSRRSSKRRRNRGVIRQGEWFFIPAPNLRVNDLLVLRNEPLQRNVLSKPHVAEQCFRTGGETVYVGEYFPSGFTQTQLEAWRRRHPRAKARWTLMRRDAGVYVRGRITHPDHSTLVLNGWHRVEVNTEGEARASRNVVFLD